MEFTKSELPCENCLNQVGVEMPWRRPKVGSARLRVATLLGVPYKRAIASRNVNSCAQDFHTRSGAPPASRTGYVPIDNNAIRS